MLMPMPEYMRIRAYVMNLIKRADRSNLQIPSENDFCRLFNVSRPTVRKAIKGLINDHYLISHRGVGTYINPEKIETNLISRPVIGVISGNGQNTTTPVSANLSRIIEKNGFAYQPLYLPKSDDPQRLVEIVENGMVAVIWWNPLEVNTCLKALQELTIPLLIFSMESIPEFDNIVTHASAEETGNTLADYIFSHGHHKLLYIHNTGPLDIHLQPGSWLDCFSKRMIELTGEHYTAEEQVVYLKFFHDKLKEIKPGNDIPLIYSLAASVPHITRIIQEESLSVPEDISYLSYREPANVYFQNRSCAFVDEYNPILSAFYNWCNRRIIQQDRSGSFFERISSIIIDGETVEDKTRRKAL